MKSNYLVNKIGAAIFSLSLLFGIGIAATSTAQAQWQNNGQWRNEQNRRQRQNDDWRRNDRNRRGRNDDGYGNYGGSYELRQTALNAGYNNGMQEGRRDRQRGERFEYRDESAFQKGTQDYNSRMGDRALYQQYFREAFARGYQDGYGGY
ncbi:MAG TPA: hypothetical protein VK619_00585 [Pyrinomonadaceae bacterium]|nr:hypothetical protein [Pyrinomonadaceae bacterium]